jgi:hypothetical protein
VTVTRKPMERASERKAGLKAQARKAPPSQSPGVSKALVAALEQLLGEGRLDASVTSQALQGAALGAAFAMALLGDRRTRALLRMVAPQAGKPATQMAADDPETPLLREMLSAWWVRFGPEDVTAAQAIAAVHVPRQRECAVLHDALLKAAGDRGGTVNARRLGHWLRRNTGRTLDGRRFERGRNRDGVARWWVEEVATTRAGS